MSTHRTHEFPSKLKKEYLIYIQFEIMIVNQEKCFTDAIIELQQIYSPYV